MGRCHVGTWPFGLVVPIGYSAALLLQLPLAVMWEGPARPGEGLAGAAHCRQKGSYEHTGVCCYFKGLPQGPGPINTQTKRFYEGWG